ncbi:hypothetical protein DFH09DRAFT_1088157 [Mycena vulgaris]|nr:hypothetical protein DFH09DRAFT_1088157 [Mycena vulgaris]
MYALKLGLLTVPVFTGVTGAVKPSADEICGTGTGRQTCRPSRQRAAVDRRLRLGSRQTQQNPSETVQRFVFFVAAAHFEKVVNGGVGGSLVPKAQQTAVIMTGRTRLGAQNRRPSAFTGRSRSNENRSITGLNWNFERENKGRRAVVLIRENAEPEQLLGPSNHSPARDAEPLVPQQNRGLDVSYGRSGRGGNEVLVRVLNGPAYLIMMVDSELWSVLKSMANVETKREL